MTTQAFGDQFVKRSRKTTIKTQYKECVKKADADGIVLFGLDEKGCWRRNQTQSSYTTLGSSEQCKKRGQYQMGLMKSKTIFVYKKKEGKREDNAIMRHIRY